MYNFIFKLSYLLYLGYINVFYFIIQFSLFEIYVFLSLVFILFY